MFTFKITTNPFVDQFQSAQLDVEVQIWNGATLVATITPTPEEDGIEIVRTNLVSIDPNNPADELQQITAPLILSVNF